MLAILYMLCFIVNSKVKKNIKYFTALWTKQNVFVIMLCIISGYAAMGLSQINQKNIEELVENFIFSLYSQSENTQKTYASILKRYAAEMNRIERITLEHIERYIISLRNKYKPSSVNLIINAIKSFYNYLEPQGYPNIGKLLKRVPALPQEQRILSHEEYNKICVRCPKDGKLDCFVFLCHTGLRVSEFISLKPENIANGFLRVIGKGRKGRSIPLNQTVKEIYLKNKNFEMIKHRNRMWIFILVFSCLNHLNIYT